MFCCSCVSNYLKLKPDCSSAGARHPPLLLSYSTQHNLRHFVPHSLLIFPPSLRPSCCQAYGFLYSWSPLDSRMRGGTHYFHSTPTISLSFPLPLFHSVYLSFSFSLRSSKVNLIPESEKRQISLECERMEMRRKDYILNYNNYVKELYM